MKIRHQANEASENDSSVASALCMPQNWQVVKSCQMEDARVIAMRIRPKMRETSSVPHTVSRIFCELNRNTSIFLKGILSIFRTEDHLRQIRDFPAKSISHLNALSLTHLLDQTKLTPSILAHIGNQMDSHVSFKTVRTWIPNPNASTLRVPSSIKLVLIRLQNWISAWNALWQWHLASSC